LLLTLVAPQAYAQPACNVVYTISPQNTTAFGAAITIENTGTTAWTSWTLTWAFANGQTVSQLWSGVETQSGANVTVANESYNGSIAAGGSLSGIGFNGTWNGVTNAVPASFAINGTTCGGAATGSFTLKPSAAALSIAQGASGTDTITVTDVSPFTGSVTLAASGLPSGVTAAFGTNPTTGTSVMTLTAGSTATAGTSTVTIAGTSGTLTASTTVALTVTSVTGSFSLKPSAATLAVTTGGSGTDTITVTDVSPFTGSVTLAASGLPSGVIAAFGTNPTTGTSVLTLTAAGTATLGAATVTITGTSGTLTASSTIALTVNAPPSFTLAPSTSTLSVSQGGSGTDTITVTDVGGFTGSVTLAASGLPSGVTAAFGTNPATGTSVLTLTAGSTATAGAATVTITGTSGTLTASTTIALSVTTASTGACQVVYTISPQSSAAFGAAITIENTSTTALTSWTLTWAFANGQTVSSLWNGLETQSGANVTVTNESYNGSIPAGGSLTSVGFNGTWNGVTNAVPTSFAINGTTCGGGGAVGSFTLKPAAATQSVAQGASATDTITITDVSPFTGSVSFAASGLPSGVTASFSPASSTSSSVLTLTASSTATAGTSTVTITGTSGTLTATTTIALTVTAATPDFTLSASPANLTVVAGSTGPSTITVADEGGFTGSVTLAASGLPTGVTAAFATNPATSTSVLTFTAAATATAGSSTITITGTSGTLAPVTTTIALAVAEPGGLAETFKGYFLDMYGDMTQANGYFSPLGIPYHSVETMIIEAPDYGHETVSETYSYYLWLESLYGAVTGTWTPLQTAWDSYQTYMIPSAAEQPTNAGYNPNAPATYAPTWDSPSNYPSTLDTSVTVGIDPLATELATTYGTPNIYGAHWIMDTSDWYGYGINENGTGTPSCINTYQRGPQESVWLTVPQPCWDNFVYGNTTDGGYLSLFTSGPYTPQWKYTDAPDADARAVQAMYWAQQYSNGNSAVTNLLPLAAELGDYLRYSFFDKYFKEQGCQSLSCPVENGTKNSSAYLLSWYYAWGGALPADGNWAWRIGSSDIHFGYQNPLAAYALSTDTALTPKSPTAKADWTTGLERQIEFYRWLQSSNGAIAGGATNSWGGGSNANETAWGGQYAVPPAGTSTFYGLSYIAEPSYDNPPSNQWFGFQAWSMERVAEYYYVTGNAKAKIILDPWIAWVEANTTTSGTSYAIPSSMTWSGQPALDWNAATQNWTPGTAFNAGLTVTITATSQDVGVTGSLCKALLYYSAGTAKWAGAQDIPSFTLAQTLLKDIWADDRDSIGVSAPETGTTYNQITTPIYIPPGWTGSMPNGDPINSDSTFLSIRTKYESDPEYPVVAAYAAGTGPAPVFRFHRFWAQTDAATAYAVYYLLFPND
jgi:hypothetical protein